MPPSAAAASSPGRSGGPGVTLRVNRPAADVARQVGGGARGGGPAGQEGAGALMAPLGATESSGEAEVVV